MRTSSNLSDALKIEQNESCIATDIHMKVSLLHAPCIWSNIIRKFCIFPKLQIHSVDRPFVKIRRNWIKINFENVIVVEGVFYFNLIFPVRLYALALDTWVFEAIV